MNAMKNKNILMVPTLNIQKKIIITFLRLLKCCLQVVRKESTITLITMNTKVNNIYTYYLYWLRNEQL